MTRAHNDTIVEMPIDTRFRVSKVRSNLKLRFEYVCPRRDWASREIRHEDTVMSLEGVLSWSLLSLDGLWKCHRDRPAGDGARPLFTFRVHMNNKCWVPPSDKRTRKNNGDHEKKKETLWTWTRRQLHESSFWDRRNNYHHQRYSASNNTSILITAANDRFIN